MAGEYLEIESLDMLIKAVEEYQEELALNKQILVNAANVCDQAMGSDDIAQKYIGRLNEALEELNMTAQIAASVTEALMLDRLKALEVYDD